MRVHFSSKALDYQTLRAMAATTFGGYYAPRAAAFDDRVAACVASDHMHDRWRASAAEPPRVASVVGRAPDWLVNGLARAAERSSVDSRWLMANSRWVFDVDSAADLQRALRAYSLADVAGRIDCPTLVLAGEDDHLVPASLAEPFVDLVGGPTTLRTFETASGAAEHCQVGNLRLATGVIDDWLDGTLGRAGGRSGSTAVAA